MSSTVRVSGALLWLRAALLATVALCAGTLAHLGAHGLLPGPTALPLPHWVLHLTEDLSGPHAAMALAHAAAAAVVGLWLARGEHALWVLVWLAGRSLARLAGPVPLIVGVAGPPRVVRADHTLLPPTSRALARTLRRRGPPLPQAA